MVDKYLISDLAEKAGVTVRTIRYYTQLGLLPEPERPGKFACYTNEHLAKLELILKLKDLRLPLWEIEQVIKTPDTGELQKLMEKIESSTAKPFEAARKAPEEKGKPGENALEYIANIMNAQQYINENQVLYAPASPAPQSYLSRKSSSTQWDRIEISSEIEIHCRQPLSSEKQKKLDKLIEYANQLFTR
jgi:DNA-binding transcriptional MerR regulator